MVSGMIAFVAGIGLFQLVPSLPGVQWLVLFPIPIALVFCFPKLRWLWLAGAGFLWALAQAQWILSDGLALGLERRDVLIEGVVRSLPEQRQDFTRFEFDVAHLWHQGREARSPGRIRLGWYHGAPRLEPGQRWRLLVRLKQPHGFSNPWGFDYEGWLFRHRLRATGYVRESAQNQQLEGTGTGFWIHRVRGRIRSRLDAALEGSPVRGLILALAIGDRSAVVPEQWRIFINTGTNHLIAISGLHIGIVAGLIMFLAGRLWTRSERLLLWCPASQAAAVAGLFGALFYAGLAGFSVPTQRAVIMLGVVLGSRLARRTARPLHILVTALFAVVVIDPVALLSGSLWLSFGAVAVIFYGLHPGAVEQPRFRRWGWIHWVIGIGLMPLLLWLYGQVPLAAPVYNFFAVPLFSLLIVPLVLLGTLLAPVPGVGSGLLELTQWLLSSSVWLLNSAGEWTGLLVTVPALPFWVWLPVLIGVALLLAPRGLPARWLGWIFLLPLLTVRPALPEPGAVWFTLLDVGQGLASVVRTRHHTLIYDTGGSFSSGFDAGSSVIAPYLRALGVRRIDRLILSNGDKDHAGGAPGLLARVPATDILTGEASRLMLDPYSPVPCEAGESWQWDGVRFRILHPQPMNAFTGNDASCVLMVDNGERRILLPGDIGASVEKKLVETGGESLRADILVVPHHGSNTSSTPGFITSVQPKFALFATGYLNRYSFPKPRVVRRWAKSGARLLDTAQTGAIGFRVSGDGRIEGPALARRNRMRYWTQRPTNSIVERKSSED